MCSDNQLVLDKLVKNIEEDITEVKEKSKLSYPRAEEDEFHTPWNKSFVEKLKNLYQIMVPQVTRLQNEPENSEIDKEKRVTIYFFSKEEYNIRCAQNLGRLLEIRSIIAMQILGMKNLVVWRNGLAKKLYGGFSLEKTSRYVNFILHVY